MNALRVRSHLTTTMHFYLNLFVVSNDKMKWVAWLPMRSFASDNKKNSVVVVKCEWALRPKKYACCNGIGRVRTLCCRFASGIIVTG